MDRPHGAPMRARRLLRAAGALVAFASMAACSGGYDRIATSSTTTTTSPRATTTTAASNTTTTAPPTTTTRPGPTTTVPTGPTSTTTTIPGSPAGLPGRIALLALDGSLLTVRPDGTDPIVLAQGSPGSSVASPTWSPDAGRLIWTALATNSVRVRTARVDATDARDAALSPPGSVYLWNRSSTAVVALRATSPTAVELDTLDLTTLAPTSLRTGSPLFASWSPDGSRLLAHVGADELALVRPNGTVTPVAVKPGSFGTPQWLDDKTVLVAVRDGSAQYLSLVDVDAGTRRDLVSFTGAIRFQLAPGGAKVAYQVVPDSGGGGTGSNVAFAQTTVPPAPTTTLPQAALNQLAVLDIATKAVTTVRDTPASAFVWNPAGDRLAFLTPEANDAYRWHFWNPQLTIDGPTYAPTRSFLTQYVRAFDQYAQSVQWWSPDGAAFVYAGRTGPRSGVWVQQMQAGMAPSLISDGDTAIWSPR